VGADVDAHQFTAAGPLVTALYASSCHFNASQVGHEATFQTCRAARSATSGQSALVVGRSVPE